MLNLDLRDRPRGAEAIKDYAQSVGKPVTGVIALARANDPFYSGTAADVEKATWFRQLWDRFGFTRGAHLRRIHYRIVVEASIEKPDGHVYQNTQQDWDYLCASAKQARYLGYVSVDAFSDHRNPDPHIHADYDYWHDTDTDWNVDVSGWDVPSINVQMADDLELRLPSPYVSGYGYDAAQDQPYHLEILCEKTTMNDVMVPLCKSLGANYVTSAGFQSITGVIDLLKRARKANKPTRVFYVSDYDPAGDAMPVAVARQIEFFCDEYAPGIEIKLQPVVLTKAQVLRYRLPTVPIKETDKRANNFEARTGIEGAVELDALEGLYPGTLAQIIREVLAPYRDMRLSRELERAARRAEAKVRDAWEDKTAGLRDRLARNRVRALAVYASYEAELNDIRARMEAELTPIREDLEDIQIEARGILDELKDEIELPERPEPETDEPYEGEVLFDSSRDYGDQLEAYRARRAGETY